MKIKHYPTFSAPSETQKQLLRAILWTDERARIAWHEWFAAVDIENLEYSSYRLLPLLYQNLMRLGVQTKELGRFKGVYHRTWLENQIRMQAVASLLRYPQMTALNPIVFRGGGLAIGYYANMGLRPMSNIDIFVSPHKKALVMTILQQEKWQRDYKQKRGIDIQKISSFTKDGLKLNLHHSFFITSQTENVLEQSMAYRFPITYNKHQFFTLNPTLQMLTVCVHGCYTKPGSRLHWIADAAHILQIPNQPVNWTAISTIAAQWNVRLPLRTALHILQDSVGLSVPPHIMTQLNDDSYTLAESLDHYLLTGRWFYKLIK